jgi:hypothetical protein
VPIRKLPRSGNGLAVVALIAALTVMRIVYASVLDLRTDEAYYWTWSKEGALSFLDHPPMIAWFIRFGHGDLGRHHARRALWRHRGDAGHATAARRHRPPRHP